MSSTKRQIATLAAINILLIIAVAVAAASLIIPISDLRSDFYPHYVGGRAVWNGDMPYARAITEQIQMDMYGSLQPPEADQQNMAYPAYASIVLGPLLLLPARIAIVLWLGIQFVALLWTPVIWLRILNWRPHPLLAAGLLLGFQFVFRYPMEVFVLGQFTGTVLLAISLGFLLLLKKRDILAGVILTLAAIPPTTGGALALSMLVAFALRRRWRGLAAFSGTLLVLTAISFVLIGNWFPDYMAILKAYSGYADVPWAMQIIGSPPLAVVFAVFLIMLSLWMLYRFLQHDSTRNAIDLVIMALIVVLLLLPQTGEYYLALLIPVLLTCVFVAREQNHPARGLIWLSVGFAIVSPWIYPRRVLPYWPVLVIPLQTLLTWLITNFFWWTELRSFVRRPVR